MLKPPHAPLMNDARLQPSTFRKNDSEQATVGRSVGYGRQVGGGTVHFTANYWRFHEIDFHEREVWGAIYALDVDQIEGEIENARRHGRVHALDDFERATLHNACRMWLSLIIEPAQLWPEIAESARCEERSKGSAVPAAVLDMPIAAALEQQPAASVLVFRSPRSPSHFLTTVFAFERSEARDRPTSTCLSVNWPLSIALVALLRLDLFP